MGKTKTWTSELSSKTIYRNQGDALDVFMEMQIENEAKMQESMDGFFAGFGAALLLFGFDVKDVKRIRNQTAKYLVKKKINDICND